MKTNEKEIYVMFKQKRQKGTTYLSFIKIKTIPFRPSNHV